MAYNPNVDAFNADVLQNNGYRYTTNARFSSRLANNRLNEVTRTLADWRGQKVLDVGCGDGTFTAETYDLGRPACMHALDPAATAIAVARGRVGKRKIHYSVGSGHQLPYPDDSFDWAYFRVVLHHMSKPVDALREGFRVAPRLLVIEPNGYNPVLKLLERYSPYHVEHDEKSFPPARLDRWVRDLGGKITRRQWAGLVPFFCPDWFARAVKRVEPAAEKTPLVRSLGCAVYAFVAQRRGNWRRRQAA